MGASCGTGRPALRRPQNEGPFNQVSEEEEAKFGSLKLDLASRKVSAVVQSRSRAVAQSRSSVAV